MVVVVVEGCLVLVKEGFVVFLLGQFFLTVVIAVDMMVR